jgi:Uma2 family endonuclease
MIHAGFGSGCDYDPATIPAPSGDGPTPVWELATMYPPQGSWSVEEYLELTDWSNRLVEYTEGELEFLPMPTFLHQVLLAHLMQLLTDFASRNEPAWVLPAGLRIKVSGRKFREPDIVYLRKGDRSVKGDRYFTGADLVVEIVSDDARSNERDYAEKFSLYATVGVPEYWIVDPQQSKVTVYTLPEGATAYTLHGEFTPGQQATSKLLDGFVVDVAGLFDSAKG